MSSILRKHTRGGVLWLACAALAVTGTGCVGSSPPLLPAAAGVADGRIVETCERRRVDEGPSPTGREVRARRADVLALVGEFKRAPDKNFRLDDSDDATTTIRELVAERLDQVRGGPCDILAHELARALYPEGPRISPTVEICLVQAGARIATRDSDIAFYFADRARGRLGKPFGYQDPRLAGVELRSAPTAGKPPGSSWLLWLVQTFGSPAGWNVSDVIRQGRRDSFIAYAQRSSARQNAAIRTCLGL